MFTMILSNFFNTKFIVQFQVIQGYIFRKFLWKNLSNKIYAVFAQLNQQKNYYLKKRYLKKKKCIW